MHSTYRKDQLVVVFGNKHGPFQIPEATGSPEEELVRIKNLANALSHESPVADLVLLDMTHSTISHHITAHNVSEYFPRSREGDALVTAHKKIGIGIDTADCLPIILYDSQQQVIAMIHAGWRGAAGGIITKTLEQMKLTSACNPQKMIAVLGPSAQGCCYEVSPGFEKNFPAEHETSLLRRDNKLYFDLPAYASTLLSEEGILHENIVTEHNACTICTPEFFSYRRDKPSIDRNITIAIMSD